MRRSSVWMWALAAAPAAWLLLFGLFVLRARFALGRWPSPHQPDPKDLGFDFHYLALVIGMPSLFAATACVTVLTLVAHRRSGREWSIPAVAIASLAALALLARIDPWHTFTWIGD